MYPNANQILTLLSHQYMFMNTYQIKFKSDTHQRLPELYCDGNDHSDIKKRLNPNMKIKYPLVMILEGS